MTTTTTHTCRHCERPIVYEDGLWIDPAATGDDSIWRETCDSHDTMTAEHEAAGQCTLVISVPMQDETTTEVAPSDIIEQLEEIRVTVDEFHFERMTSGD